jgi:hypothetical protein
VYAAYLYLERHRPFALSSTLTAREFAGAGEGSISDIRPPLSGTPSTSSSTSSNILAVYDAYYPCDGSVHRLQLLVLVLFFLDSRYVLISQI